MTVVVTALWYELKGVNILKVELIDIFFGVKFILVKHKHMRTILTNDYSHLTCQNLDTRYIYYHCVI